MSHVYFPLINLSPCLRWTRGNASEAFRIYSRLIFPIGFCARACDRLIGGEEMESAKPMDEVIGKLLLLGDRRERERLYILNLCVFAFDISSV